MSSNKKAVTHQDKNKSVAETPISAMGDKFPKYRLKKLPENSDQIKRLNCTQQIERPLAENPYLFASYDNELVLRLHNAKNLRDTRTILVHFEKHLGDNPPTAELAKSFLVRFADKQPRTLYRYFQMVKAFMKWYGDPIDDLRIKVPKSIPKYTDDSPF
jgi:hypothetical protein